MVVLSNKETKWLLPYRIYRGRDEDLVDIPIPKSVDFFDTKKTFGEKLMAGLYGGMWIGSTAAFMDIAYHTKLRERRAQLIRYTYFAAPAVLAGVGYVAALELAKKNTSSYYGAYTFAAMVPAGIAATWRRDIRWFPKSFVPMAMIGIIYTNLTENNLNMEFFNSNPNAPGGPAYKNHNFLSWPHKLHLGPRLEQDMFKIEDPGPTYAKWEK